MSKQELHPRTAVLNKNQKNHSRRLRTEALSWLATRFPAAFDNSICIRPLKIGIMDDVLQHADEAEAIGISKSKLREAIVLFTRRLDYLTCLKAREMRIDLEGQIITEVTLEEAEHAALKIKKRVEKSLRNARKQAPVTKTTSTNHYSSSYNKSTAVTSAEEDYFPIYPTRNTQPTPPAPATKTPVVTVKHKATKPYDPDAVARLKEKLGLSRNPVIKTETVE